MLTEALRPHAKAWVAGMAAFLAALATAPIDWSNPSGDWVQPMLTAAVAALTSAGAVWVTPNRPRR